MFVSVYVIEVSLISKVLLLLKCCSCKVGWVGGSWVSWLLNGIYAAVGGWAGFGRVECYSSKIHDSTINSIAESFYLEFF